MADQHAFPHLNWTHQGSFDVYFGGGRVASPEVLAAQADRGGHSERIKSQLDEMRRNTAAQTESRRETGLPNIKGKGFLLKIPEGTDVDSLAHALGVELIAETESGLMFAASDNLDFERLREVIAKFESNIKGGGNAANILEVFHEGDDPRKIGELLVGRALELWPFQDPTIYTFDIGIKTAASTRRCQWTTLPRKGRNQSADERTAQVNSIRLTDRLRAEEAWDDAAAERFGELQEFIRHYGGQIIDGLKHADLAENRQGIIFPDSVEVRVKMTGRGFRDLVLNFPLLFEVTLPPEVRYLPGSVEADGDDGDLDISAPDDDAPKVCVIDSGIQEEHRWIEPAMDSASSRCFLPEKEFDEVADHVAPRGHGTRVAGAVLYPREVPKNGEITSVAWIQNARVLNEHNELPESLPPERYLTEVVAHFGLGPHGTKIFNHSISDSKPCESKRMCSWAAKMDDLAHRNDILFVQIAGNVSSAEIFEGLGGDLEHPAHLLEANAKIASPGQSLHSLTVGSVSHEAIDVQLRESFARYPDFPSAFTRSGYSPLWDVVKPEVVEYGGDRLRERPLSRSMPTTGGVATELVASTLHGAPALSRDDVGTSFAAPKVAHIAAQIQNLFPGVSPQLYRALIVQSARWPVWAENGANADEVLRMIGYGIPSLERATSNTSRRVTLITGDAKEIWSKQYHLYQIAIPEEIRGAAVEGTIRIDVTLAYTACPRRTRSRRTGYLETWLDWRSIGIDESIGDFTNRMEGTRGRGYTGIRWHIHQNGQHGEVEGSRDRGSVQKDWAVIEANQMPEVFAIAVRAHVGWNHKEGGGLARYCLVVTFEALNAELPIYSSIRTEIEGEAQTESEAEVRSTLF